MVDIRVWPAANVLSWLMRLLPHVVVIGILIVLLDCSVFILWCACIAVYTVQIRFLL